MQRHDSNYTSIGNTKDVGPEVLQGLLNFIDSNTQESEEMPQVDIPFDVKEDIASTPPLVPEVKDEVTPLRQLNSVSFGIREQCKLITDLTYEMEDAAYGNEVLSKITALYKDMYHVCRKESPIMPLRTDHLKFSVLSGRRRNRGVYCRRRIVPLFPSKTPRSRQSKQSRFGRKSTSQVSETKIDVMLNPEAEESEDSPTPMDLSDDEDNIAPFIDLASYRTQDQVTQKVLTTPGLSLRQQIYFKVYFSYYFLYMYINKQSVHRISLSQGEKR